ncbi:MAG: TonB-dependent receptor [Acidobacteria bacterium]|nr:TonB-dependent receptor [Acidobacteriota bacterium]
MHARSRFFQLSFTVLLLLFSSDARAGQPAGTIAGHVLDPLGARVRGASVTLLREDARLSSATTDDEGAFSFPAPAERGRCRIEAVAPGFLTARLPPFFVDAAGRRDLRLVLSLGPFAQETVVSAAAAELPQSQVGASVTVIDRADLDASRKAEVLEALRTVPGAFVLQTGARGGTASLFLRGGNSGFAKVIVDGVPVNEIGGAFNFSDLQTTGIERVEVLRGANSVLYGTDALAGVVTVTTRRGRSRRPEVVYATEGGSFGTSRHTTSVAGAAGRLDYFSAFSRIDTDNQTPNGSFVNDTYTGRFGAAAGRTTDIDLAVRHSATRQGVPNAVDYFGIADDSSQRTTTTTVALSARSRLGSRLTTDVRVSSVEYSLRLDNPAPTGEPFDPFGFGPTYLGDVVTIRGANGTVATGRAVLDFGGAYPMRYDSESRRRSLYAVADYRLRPALSVAGGLRLDDEHGVSGAGLRQSVDRRDVGAFVEARAATGRLFVNAGLGVDHHTVFQTTVVPRLSVAAYLRAPAASARLGETKVTFNAGRGVKAPSLLQELSSLSSLVQASPSATLSVDPLRPERSTGLDVGLEQAALGGRVRLNVTWFENRFTDLIEYVGSTWLSRFGVADDLIAAAGYGAYMNSQAYRARGLETAVTAALAPPLRVTATYTYLSSRVTRSFDSSALLPSINPAYPDQPIGTYSPLVGGRPFRRPAHTGGVVLEYSQGPLRLFANASMAGRYDDSTFLSDPDFGSTMLLPNRDLGAAVRRVDATMSWALTPHVSAYVAVDNLLNAQYESASGYPALDRAGRAGLRIGFGGDRTPISPARQD